jgi:hypothetical protein
VHHPDSFPVPFYSFPHPPPHAPAPSPPRTPTPCHSGTGKSGGGGGSHLRATEAQLSRDRSRGDVAGGAGNYYKEVKVCARCYAVYSILDRAREVLRVFPALPEPAGVGPGAGVLPAGAAATGPDFGAPELTVRAVVVGQSRQPGTNQAWVACMWARVAVRAGFPLLFRVLAPAPASAAAPAAVAFLVVVTWPWCTVLIEVRCCSGGSLLCWCCGSGGRRPPPLCPTSPPPPPPRLTPIRAHGRAPP